MNIAIVGAGIIGVTTAYELARDGHQITVFEQRSAVAEEASFASAGVMSALDAAPWSAPGLLWKLLLQGLQARPSMRLMWPFSSADAAWLWRFWRASSPQQFRAQSLALQQLAVFSRSQLAAISQRHELSFERAGGYLVALRSEKDRALLQPRLAVLRELGLPFQELDESAARLIEPGLNPDTRFAGAVHLAQDEVANCRQFALLLKDECRRIGVQFEFNSRVEKVATAQVNTRLGATLFVANRRPPSPLSNSPWPHSHEVQAIDFDALVLCTGAQAAGLLAPLGIELPLRPVYGYSLSAHLKEPMYAPLSGFLDERYRVSITRQGQRLRVAGGAQLGGKAGQINNSAIRMLYRVLHDWFPGAAHLSQGVQPWQGARAMLAHRPPVIGRATANGSIWLNLGHGASGWALACGSARILADQIGAQSSPIDLSPFAL